VENLAKTYIGLVDYSKKSGLEIRHIDNLTIEANDDVSIINSPDVDTMLIFLNCNKITLKGLSLKSIRNTYPENNSIITFHICNEIKIENCIFTGSDCGGIGFEECRNVIISGTEIRNCAEGICWLNKTRNVTFESNLYENNSSAKELIEIISSRDVSFSNCRFNNNYGIGLFGIYKNSSVIKISSSLIEKNIYTTLLNKTATEITLEEITYKDNIRIIP
jgi:polygalacturonase